MYITNPDSLNNAYKCKDIVAKYLIKNECIPIGKKDDINYFSNTEHLRYLIKTMPYWIKIFAKEVDNS